MANGSQLKSYKCTKEVQATPMGRQEAERLDLVRDVTGKKGQGYFVKYPSGYVSWSPKKEFDEGYVEIIEESTNE